MKSQWVKWAVCLVFGILTGFFSGGLLLPLVIPFLTNPSETGASGSFFVYLAGGVALLSRVVQVAVAVAVTILLARIDNMKRRIGWGCIVFGAVVIASMASAFATYYAVMREFVDPDMRAEQNMAETFFSWSLDMSLPSIIIGVLLIGGGLLLVVKGRSEARSEA